MSVRASVRRCRYLGVCGTVRRYVNPRHAVCYVVTSLFGGSKGATRAAIPCLFGMSEVLSEVTFNYIEAGVRPLPEELSCCEDPRIHVSYLKASWFLHQNTLDRFIEIAQRIKLEIRDATRVKFNDFVDSLDKQAPDKPALLDQINAKRMELLYHGA